MSGVYNQPQGGGQQDTTIRDLLAVLFRRKWIILGIFLFTTTIVGYRTFTRPVTFSADATLILNRQGQRSSVLERTGRALPWVEVIESEVEVAQSTPVLERARETLLAERDKSPSISALSRRVRAGVINESNVLYITASARDAEEAVAIANAVARAYAEVHGELFKLPDASLSMQTRADSTFSKLENLQQLRENLLNKVGVTEVDDEERALINNRELFRQELAKVQRRRSRLQTELDDSRAALQGGLRALPFEQNTGSIQGATINSTMKELRSKRANLSALRSKYTENHPEVAELRTEVQRLENDIRLAIEEMVAIKEHEVRVAHAEENDLRAQVAVVDGRLARMPNVMRQLNVLDAQIAALGKQFSDLSQEAVTLAIASESYRDYEVKVLSPAVGAARGQRGELVRLALAPLLALMFGVGLAFYIENMDHSLSNREDIEGHLDLPVLASFPDVPLGGGAGGPTRRRKPFSRGRPAGG